MVRTAGIVGLGLCLLTATLAGAVAQARPGGGKSGLGDLGSSREPIKIDADRLDVFDKEGRAVFSGNVVAVQGDSTMNCTAMNVFYEGGRAAAVARGATTAATGGTPTPTASRSLAGGMPGGDAIRRIECRGPVTITSKTQVATGDRAEFDRTKNKVFLIGNAALSDGPNVTKGERVAYDLNTGIANVEGGRDGGRVRALIVPNSGKAGATPVPGGAPASASQAATPSRPR